MARAAQETLDFRGFEIRTYSWNPGATPPILLVHGWEGQAGNFADLVDRLVAEGHSVFSFDAPAHGLSSRAPTTIFDFISLVALMIERVRPNLLVSHSFGSVATTAALSELPDVTIERYAMVTTPDRFQQRIDELTTELGVSQRACARLVQRLESEIGQPVSELNVSDYVGHIRVGTARIFHDKSDRIIDIEHARRVASSDERFELEEVEGTGHYRILRTPAVLDSIRSFLLD